MFIFLYTLNSISQEIYALLAKLNFQTDILSIYFFLKSDFGCFKSFNYDNLESK